MHHDSTSLAVSAARAGLGSEVLGFEDPRLSYFAYHYGSAFESQGPVPAGGRSPGLIMMIWKLVNVKFEQVSIIHGH